MILSLLSSFMVIFKQQTRFVAAFKAHDGPTACIAFSPNGKYMATGGLNGLIIWDLATRKRVEIPNQQFNERTRVSTICWVTRRNEAVDTICYGNAVGFLVFLQYNPTAGRFENVWSSRVARGGEILRISVDESAGDVSRIAICTRDQCILIWTFNAKTNVVEAQVSKVYTSQRDVVPKCVVFDNNLERDFFVFGLYDGNLYKYGGKDTRSIASHQLGSNIGNAAVNLEHRICVVDNISDGFDIYKLDNGRFELSLTTRKSDKTYPKEVTFASQGRAVVGGSDHGLVYIFERKTGKMITTLRYSKRGGAEVIATYDCDDGTVLIATGTGTIKDNEAAKVYLWRWTPAPERKPEDDAITFKKVLVWFLNLAFFVAGLAYAYEKIVLKFSSQGIPKYTEDSTEQGARDWIDRGWANMGWHFVRIAMRRQISQSASDMVHHDGEA